MTDLTQAARMALPLLERDCASLLTCHQDPKTGAIPAEEPEVVAMYDEYVSAIAALRAALEAQQEPAQPQGWVPVTERLPEKHVEVLICFAGQNTLASTGQYTGSDKDVEGWCYPWENRAATDSGDDPVVTHWMPLPEVPAARRQPKEPQA